jgi:hypothetical protein
VTPCSLLEVYFIVPLRAAGHSDGRAENRRHPSQISGLAAHVQRSISGPLMKTSHLIMPEESLRPRLRGSFCRGDKVANWMKRRLSINSFFLFPSVHLITTTPRLVIPSRTLKKLEGRVPD